MADQMNPLVYKLSHRVWSVSTDNYEHLVYYNRGFKCSCNRYLRRGMCDDIRQVLRNNNEKEKKDY